jgi:hypothetical protein
LVCFVGSELSQSLVFLLHDEVKREQILDLIKVLVFQHSTECGHCEGLLDEVIGELKNLVIFSFELLESHVTRVLL